MYTHGGEGIGCSSSSIALVKLGMGLLPAAAPIQFEQTASLELPFPSS